MEMTLEQEQALAMAAARARMAEATPSSGGFAEGLKNAGMGALKGASDIGATLLWPIDATGITGRSNAERRDTLKSYFQDHADPESLAFKGGALGAQIAGTAGAPGVIAKGAALIPGIARLAPAIASGGFNLGGAATNSGIINAATRAAGGAIGGGVQAGMVDPDSAGAGVGVGAVTPGAVKLAGMAGAGIRKGLEFGADRLMQSALKPTVDQLRSGEAKTAIQTLLEEGINPTRGGVEKIRSRIGDINSQVDGLISGSNGTVSKQSVIDALRSTKQKFANQVSPTADLTAIDAVSQDFAAHPNITGSDIPVQLAQELKKGTYRVLKGKYGEVGSASTEAQKSLARGLKEGISNAVPEVSALNAREGRLLDTLDVAERRALMDANKNPVGFAILAHNPASWAAFMADKSALFKSIAARMLNQTAQAPQVPKALTNATKAYGVLGAPAVAGASLQIAE